MSRYRPGDHVLFQLSRYELMRLQKRTGSSALPAFKVVRILPIGDDGEYSYHVQCSSEAYARVAREHELAPAM